ncbi:MAG: amidase [Verrucomicrobiota bacterium]
MLRQLTISELVGRLARREGSARETLQSCLDQIQRVDSQVKAFLSVDIADAQAQADAADRDLAAGVTHAEKPLLGVPIALKDVLCHRGQPCGCSSRILEGFISPYDATVVERLRAAGAVLFGRLNMDEFAMGSSTENSAFGATLNPWDTTRIPGGSSDGRRKCPPPQKESQPEEKCVDWCRTTLPRHVVRRCSSSLVRWTKET